MVSTVDDLGLERATGLIGAWVCNFELGAPGNPARSGTLLRALSEHGVLFFDFGRAPEAAEYTEFAGLFGNVQAVFGQQVKNQDEDAVPLIDSRRMPMKEHLINRWHSDGGPLEVPPLAAILTPYELPEAGGDTMWSSMYAAYDALSPTFQAMLDGLRIVNNNKLASFLEPKEHIHPAVVRNPVTGRKCLFYNPNYTECFVGLTDTENDVLCRFLTEHINTPEFHVRLNWKLGYVAVWHQQVTQHRGVADFTGPRKLKRLTVDGAPLIPANG
ncbi:MAG: TauD/TfdA family dioxygenase [Novosphingobium sp.]|jgi:taurine dioxygenase|nr:TauD/TfdA family dioxygenase [Novosphingobium sp.]